MVEEIVSYFIKTASKANPWNRINFMRSQYVQHLCVIRTFYRKEEEEVVPFFRSHATPRGGTNGELFRLYLFFFNG